LEAFSGGNLRGPYWYLEVENAPMDDRMLPYVYKGGL